MNLTRLTKTAEKIDRILKALQKLLIIGGCILLIAGVYLALRTNSSAIRAENLSSSISFGPLTIFTAAGTALRDPALLTQWMAVSVVCFAATMALAWYGIRLFRQILAPVKDGMPFRSGIAAMIRKLAEFTLIAGAIQQILSAASSAMLFRAYDLTALLNMQNVARCTLEFKFDLNFLITAVLLYLLAYIFRYGEMLQQESDETL